MIQIKFFLIIFFIFLQNQISVHAETKYFSQGKKLYDKNQLDDAKIFFEKDLVFNPKNEISYLYLSKIFKKNSEDELEENNLNTVILLNPKNEEALHNLILLKIKKSDFTEARNLISNFKQICKKLCNAEKKFQKELKNSLNE